VAKDFPARHDRHQTDVVMRAGADAIEAKRAIKISGFTREIKVRLATGLTIVSAQTIMGPATGANVRFSDFHFER
jgi:hypothetical protein